MLEGRLPAGLVVEAVLRQCDIDFIPYYIIQRGEYASGIIMVKLDGLNGQSALCIQQRDFDSGQLVWAHALNDEVSQNEKVNAYIQRSIQRDPDLWVIEFESRMFINPFEKDEIL